MMNDPDTANARIYVGGIPTHEMTKKDLEDRFRRYGEILGVVTNRGYGFIQFADRAAAMDAIKEENGSMFRNKKIEVNLARTGPNSLRGGGPTGRRGNSVERGDGFRDRSPIDDIGRDRDWRDDDRYDSYKPEGAGRAQDYYGRSGGYDEPGYGGQDAYRGGNAARDDRSTSYRKETQYGGSYLAEPRTGPPPVNTPNMERTNDCEIIVVKKEQREYAEYIEHRLKTLGLTVDLMFPKEDVPVTRVLANISSRGTLYAIMVMPQNQEHRSLTLNILYGRPQEHRNMPLEDAITFISHNFDTYLRGEKASVPTPVAVVPAAPVSALSLDERHPENIQILLNLLADNRQLTVLQYDRVIRYLQDRREVQIKLELGDPKDLPNAGSPSVKQQEELQNRILNILKKKSETPSGGQLSRGMMPVPTQTAVVAPVPNPTPHMSVAPSDNWGQSKPAGSTPLLNDPNVQKALDSLMQGNLLRSFSTSAQPEKVPAPATTLGAPPSQPLFGAFAAAKHRF